MIIGLKDGIKLVGVATVCFCAAFVCTLFLNYYIDATGLSCAIGEEIQELFDAQIMTAKVVCVVTGGVLGLIAVIMIVFYVKLYIDGNAQKFGILKAMGYRDGRLALGFWVFGLSVLIGAALGYGVGYAFMRFIYDELTIEGLPTVQIGFHAAPLLVIVVAPTVLFCALSCGYAYLAVRRNVGDLLSGNDGRKQKSGKVSVKRRSFLKDVRIATLSQKKSVVFFMAFSAFCFSAMVQMGLSMDDLSSVAMGLMILLIGVVIAVTALFMAATTAINANKRNIAVMKAFGYSGLQRAAAVFGGYIPFVFLGFIIGTVYQYAFLKIMVDVVYSDISFMPHYSFNVSAFFIALGAFAVTYSAAMVCFSYKLNRTPVKRIMEE